MASPAPNSSWIPHKSLGSEGEGGRKTEIREYFLLLPEAYEKDDCSEPPSSTNSQTGQGKHECE
jgi:hypothetical protein